MQIVYEYRFAYVVYLGAKAIETRPRPTSALHR